MKKLIRYFKHLFSARFQITQRLPKRSMNAIETAIRESEKLHMGELRFVVESSLEWQDLFAGLTSRERALQVFSQLRIWDTEQNSGVLIYLLLADRRIEIVADRGINSRVDKVKWINICQDIESQLRLGNFESGVLLGVSEITDLLQQNFPAQAHNPNDLPDRPLVI
jgi:uncharacterized membrane protein